MKTSKHSLRFHTFPISLENGFPRVHSSEHTAWNVWSRPRLKNPLTPLHDGERGGGAMPQSGMSCQSEFSCFKSSSWCPPPLSHSPKSHRFVWWKSVWFGGKLPPECGKCRPFGASVPSLCLGNSPITKVCQRHVHTDGNRFEVFPNFHFSGSANVCNCEGWGWRIP